MLILGEMQKLTIVRRVDFGVYLGESMEAPKEEQVLLPIKQVEAGWELGDRVNVFLYRDSSDRMIATTRKPLVTLHHTALLTVRETGKIGAFLDWGLEKDLLLPFRQQTCKLEAGDQVLVALYLDKSERLAATMKVYPYLKTEHDIQVGDMVEGRVYEISRNFGVFVAVGDSLSGLIPKQNAQGSFKVGQTYSLRVTEVKEDGKLTLNAKAKAYIQMNTDADLLKRALEKSGGVLNFDDKASPEKINEEMGMSKAAFKRAVGHLLKEKIIRMEGGKIYLL